jgi:hypothetical protein
MTRATADRITPRWMKLKDAAAYSAIGQNRLISLAQEGTVTGFRDPDSGRHDWIFDRDSLDAYREGQAAGGEGARFRLLYEDLQRRIRTKGKSAR